ncbi:MAG TPA: hypothetical protein VFV95_20475 [Vicinamibacterales bacterium]|nr:hypothetical protein [Vicinamibacterales bacterium]
MRAEGRFGASRFSRGPARGHARVRTRFAHEFAHVEVIAMLYFVLMLASTAALVMVAISVGA